MVGSLPHTQVTSWIEFLILSFSLSKPWLLYTFEEWISKVKISLPLSPLIFLSLYLLNTWINFWGKQELVLPLLLIQRYQFQNCDTALVWWQAVRTVINHSFRCIHSCWEFRRHATQTCQHDLQRSNPILRSLANMFFDYYLCITSPTFCNITIIQLIVPLPNCTL